MNIYTQDNINIFIIMYNLVTKDGEVIIKREASSMNDAIRIFSIIKNLTIEVLLTIYIIIFIG